jgi:hypothetical protein
MTEFRYGCACGYPTVRSTRAERARAYSNGFEHSPFLSKDRGRVRSVEVKPP